MNENIDALDRHNGSHLDRANAIRTIDPRKEKGRDGDRHRRVDTLKEHMAKFMIPRDQIVALENPTDDLVVFEAQTGGGASATWVRVELKPGETLEVPLEFAKEAIDVRGGYVCGGLAPQLRVVGRRYEPAPLLERADEDAKKEKVAVAKSVSK